jgi:hypothetical protein
MRPRRDLSLKTRSPFASLWAEAFNETLRKKHEVLDETSHSFIAVVAGGRWLPESPEFRIVHVGEPAR